MGLMESYGKKDLIEISDAELLAEIKATRNKEYLLILYERFHAGVFGLSLSYMKDFHAAEDVASRIWEIILEKIYDHKIIYLHKWIITIARNTCISYYRQNKINKQYQVPGEKYIHDAVEEPDYYVGQDKELEEKLEQEMLKALKRIPKIQAKCVKLFYFEKRSYCEIAEKMDLDIKMVKSYLQNGKRLLFNEVNNFLKNNS